MKDKSMDDIMKELNHNAHEMHELLNEKYPTIFNDDDKFYEWITTKH